MTCPVGYLVHNPPWPAGEKGSYYDYILAGNGVFIQTNGIHLSGRVQAAAGHVRGLSELAPVLDLKHGKIPSYMLDLALSAMLARPEKETYVGVYWDLYQRRYILWYPEQSGKPAALEFREGDNMVLDLHSHGAMPAFFSGVDDKDEQGLRIYGVIGRLNKRPALRLRLGIYGYYCELDPADIFDGDVKLEGEEDVPA